ncbi:MAG: triose-phosphate isomerase [Catalinimonas sp.]
MRERIVAGNWKMNLEADAAQALVSEVVNMLADEPPAGGRVVMIPPFPFLYATQRLLGEGNSLYLGAQNCHQEAKGAYTGEVSAPMLRSAGCDYVVLGHSERRAYFGERGEVIARKVDAARAADLVPIYCCGEPLEVREADEHEAYVAEQLSSELYHLGAEAVRALVIAYEPVWAIGTGKTASPEQAQDMHAAIRTQLAAQYDQATADAVTILYGGSVKPSNAAEIFAKPDVDGGLIGGASLKARDFVDIVKANG